MGIIAEFIISIFGKYHKGFRRSLSRKGNRVVQEVNRGFQAARDSMRNNACVKKLTGKSFYVLFDSNNLSFIS